MGKESENEEPENVTSDIQEDMPKGSFQRGWNMFLECFQNAREAVR